MKTYIETGQKHDKQVIQRNKEALRAGQKLEGVARRIMAEKNIDFEKAFELASLQEPGLYREYLLGEQSQAQGSRYYETA